MGKTYCLLYKRLVMFAKKEEKVSQSFHFAFKGVYTSSNRVAKPGSTVTNSRNIEKANLTLSGRAFPPLSSLLGRDITRAVAQSWLALAGTVRSTLVINRHFMYRKYFSSSSVLILGGFQPWSGIARLALSH